MTMQELFVGWQTFVRRPGRQDVRTSGRLDVWTSGRPDDVTSGRRDVRTSGQPDVCMDVRTSGRPDVQTSRPEVQTSRDIGLMIGDLLPNDHARAVRWLADVRPKALRSRLEAA